MELTHLEAWTGQEPPASLKSHFVPIKGRQKGKCCSFRDDGNTHIPEVRSYVLGSLKIAAIQIQPAGH